jgi:hypothetical protein
MLAGDRLGDRFSFYNCSSKNWVETPSFQDGFTARYWVKIEMVTDPPATMETETRVSKVGDISQRGRKIGRPGKEEGAMENIP